MNELKTSPPLSYEIPLKSEDKLHEREGHFLVLPEGARDSAGALHFHH
jgi:hypothetical protein